MRYAIALTLFISTQALASDPWICKDESSVRNDSEISSCGIGYGKNENDARLDAFDHAKKEFDRICMASSDCKDHEILVTPKRTTCEASKDGYQCTRMISFDIEVALKAHETPSSDLPRDAKPFTAAYNKVAQSLSPYPKVRIGMSKKEALAKFGVPESNQDFHPIGHEFRYSQGSPLCLPGGGCSLYFDFDTKNLVSTYHIDPHYDASLAE